MDTAEHRPARRSRVPKAPEAGNFEEPDAHTKRRKVHGNVYACRAGQQGSEASKCQQADVLALASNGARTAPEWC